MKSLFKELLENIFGSILPFGLKLIRESKYLKEIIIVTSILAIIFIILFSKLYFKSRKNPFLLYLKSIRSVKEYKKLGAKLLKACKKGNLQQVQSLLNPKSLVNYKSIFKNSPLIIACKKGHLNLAEFLLKNGASIYMKSLKGQSPLKIACHAKNYKLAELILKQSKKSAFLESLILSNDPKFIEYILDQYQMNMNSQDSLGRSLLMHAVFLKDLTVLCFLLKKGANPNLTDLKGCSALTWAFYAHNIEAVNLLLNNNALWQKEDKKRLASVRIILKRKDAMKKKLVEKGVDANLLSQIFIEEDRYIKEDFNFLK